MIVGAGLAGLSAAVRLVEMGQEVLVFEGSDRPGGRLKTDVVEGFRLDHGFQVVFTAYPALKSHLDLSALNLKAFENGSLNWDGTRLNLIHRDRPLAMALSAYLSITDKFKVLQWTQQVKQMNLQEIAALPESTSEAHLRSLDFSEAFMDKFARPFFGGVFLDRSLSTSKRMFAFVWKMLSEGATAVPALGIEEIPKQLAAKLPAGTMRCEAKVRNLLREGNKVTGVVLESGEEFLADQVILATDAETAAKLSGLAMPQGCLSSVCLYFAAPVAPVDAPILVLNATKQGIVNEVVPVSLISPDLAPSGQHLVSATVLGWNEASDAELAAIVKREVSEWFPGRRVDEWRHLKTYRIRYAQMAQPSGVFDRLPGHRTSVEGLYLAGEFNVNSSINGAIQAGFSCADAIMEKK